MYLNDDYTKIVMAKRKVQLEEQKKRKQRGQKAWLSYDHGKYGNGYTEDPIPGQEQV